MTHSILQDSPRAANRPGPPQAAASDNTVRRAAEVAILTAGEDKPYALGLAAALIDQGITFDFIGSNHVDSPFLHQNPQVRFVNMRGDQSRDASAGRKAARVIRYYVRLLAYAATARPRIFHVLWNDRFELFDRTALMLYYRLLGRRVVRTAHNVNAGRRDLDDSFINRLSLRIQYRLAHHVFVHTEKMKLELTAEFGVAPARVTVIPFGINNTLPNTELTRAESRPKLGLEPGHKALLFFGNIAAYKGLHDLFAAFAQLAAKDESYRLVIAGPVKNGDPSWAQLQPVIERSGLRGRVIERIGYIPDAEVERYLKAADVLVLPYTHIFQSGVLFVGYSFGVPVIATDVGSLREDIIEGKTGFVCRPNDPRDLARAIETYFSSDLSSRLPELGRSIQAYANERYSWSKVGEMTKRVYLGLLEK